MKGEGSDTGKEKQDAWSSSDSSRFLGRFRILASDLRIREF